MRYTFDLKNLSIAKTEEMIRDDEEKRKQAKENMRRVLKAIHQKDSQSGKNNEG